MVGAKMTANELADLIGMCGDGGYNQDAATMLRQQQAEIEALKTHPVKEQYKFGVDWSKDGNAVTVLKICEDGVAEVVFMDYQEKTTQNIHLTDEEIVGIRMTTEGDIKAFARAILLKAQEK